MDKGWAVTAKQIDWEEIEMPVENIINYRFIHKNGKQFRIRLLKDGRMEVSCDAQLLIDPRATNEINISQIEFRGDHNEERN